MLSPMNLRTEKSPFPTQSLVVRVLMGALDTETFPFLYGQLFLNVPVVLSNELCMSIVLKMNTRALFKS